MLNEKKIVGYTDRLSVAPGETVRFMVSCYGVERYHADIVRLISSDLHPDGAGFEEDEIETAVSGEYAGREQVIHAGSYAVINTATAFDALESFTLQAMIWPTIPQRGRQMLLAKWSEPDQNGFALMIDENGALALVLGAGDGMVDTVSSGKPLPERAWCFVGASFDSATGEIRVYQEPMIRHPQNDATAEVAHTTTVKPTGRHDAPFMIGACFDDLATNAAGGRVVGTAHYNGKIDSPRVAKRVLSRAEMSQLLHQPIPASLQPDVVAAWDFSRAISTVRIDDSSANCLHGVVVNLPMRAMTGYNWTDSEWNWRHAPEQYGAIHFHEDDLYDASWEADFELRLPDNMRSGVYAARLKAGDDRDYIPFFVRPRQGGRTADVALLIPTASYLAYANEHMVVEASLSEVLNGHLTSLSAEDLFSQRAS